MMERPRGEKEVKEQQLWEDKEEKHRGRGVLGLGVGTKNEE